MGSGGHPLVTPTDRPPKERGVGREGPQEEPSPGQAFLPRWRAGPGREPGVDVFMWGHRGELELQGRTGK